MSNLNILISGSGIAGSVFAFWLLRAYPNANITIVERDASLRFTGASVDIRSSAVNIIKWMGTEKEIRNQTTNEEGIQFVDTDGKAVATLRATGRSVSLSSRMVVDESLVCFKRCLCVDEEECDRHGGFAAFRFNGVKQVFYGDLIVSIAFCR